MAPLPICPQWDSTGLYTKETASTPRLNDEAGVWMSHGMAAYVIFRPSVKWKCRSSFSKVLRISKWCQQSIKPSLRLLCVRSPVHGAGPGCELSVEASACRKEAPSFPCCSQWTGGTLSRGRNGKGSDVRQTGSTVPVTSETSQDPGRADTNC